LAVNDKNMITLAFDIVMNQKRAWNC